MHNFKLLKKKKKHTHFVSNILLVSGRGHSFALPVLGSPGYISLILLPENTSIFRYIFSLPGHITLYVNLLDNILFYYDTSLKESNFGGFFKILKMAKYELWELKQMDFRNIKFKTLWITKLFDDRIQSLDKGLHFCLQKFLPFWSCSKIIIFILCVKELLGNIFISKISH